MNRMQQGFRHVVQKAILVVKMDSVGIRMLKLESADTTWDIVLIQRTQIPRVHRHAVRSRWTKIS